MITSSSSIGPTTLSGVSACLTVVEHSQQEGQTPNLEENQGFRAFQLSPQEAPASEATLTNAAAEGGTMDEKWPREFSNNVDTSTSSTTNFNCN
jgi:hypothetical protein